MTCPPSARAGATSHAAASDEKGFGRLLEKRHQHGSLVCLD
jgi:hypothetical protein